MVVRGDADADGRAAAGQAGGRLLKGVLHTPLQVSRQVAAGAPAAGFPHIAATGARLKPPASGFLRRKQVGGFRPRVAGAIDHVR